MDIVNAQIQKPKEVKRYKMPKLKTSQFEKGTFEIWTKDRLKIDSIGRHGDMKFKVLKCEYLEKQRCYAVLCLHLRKIAMLVRTFEVWSGVDRLTEQRAIEASQIGHDVTVITLKGNIKCQN